MFSEYFQQNFKLTKIYLELFEIRKLVDSLILNSIYFSIILFELVKCENDVSLRRVLKLNLAVTITEAKIREAI